MKIAKYVLDENSVLIFDCGANTKGNKKLIRTSKYHYLTLRAKKVGPYKKLVEFYKCHEKQTFALNGRIYSYVKMKLRDEVQYIFYSESLYEDQMRNKTKKFMKELEKNKTKLKKTLKGKQLGEYVCEEGYIITKGILQKVVDDIPNPYVNGIEGFFVLQSSIDDEPEKILSLYKDRDKAEKLI